MRLMTAILVLLLVFTNLQCNRAKQMPAMKDIDMIQGTWVLVSGERHGEKFTDQALKNVTLTFVGDILKMKKNTEVTEATFTLHPETKPKGMDLNMDGNIGLGIYKFEGELLTILHGEIEEPRPAGFDAVKNGNLTMLVLKKDPG
jgi:uncharacterized protein (TIGR03067 family)